MNTELMNQYLVKWKREDRVRILNMITFFHGFFARTKNPWALEVARDLGLEADKLKV